MIPGGSGFPLGMQIWIGDETFEIFYTYKSFEELGALSDEPEALLEPNDLYSKVKVPGSPTKTIWIQNMVCMNTEYFIIESCSKLTQLLSETLMISVSDPDL
jgi:hypothetical protein